MTDKKKPAPSMKVAAATQKISKSQLEELLKNAQKTTEGDSADDEDEDAPEDGPSDPKKKKKS